MESLLSTSNEIASGIEEVFEYAGVEEVRNEKATFPGEPGRNDPDPKKRPETEPGIKPEIEPGEGDDDDDDDDDDDSPFTDPEIGDDPGEERKKQPIM